MDLEELIDSIDIVEYISQFVELEEKNGEYWGLSPFSDEKTPSFSVRRENNTFYCFSSGIGGNVFTFTKFYYQCDANKAVDILKKYAGCDGTEFIPRRRMAATMACRKYMKKQVRHKESKTKRFPDDCIIFEVKYGDSEIPIGQRLALQRMVDDFTKSGKQAIVLICSHTVKNPNKPVVMAWCNVREIYYGDEKRWRTPDREIKVREAIDCFQKY